MELFGYSIWLILLICAGVFCAAFVDAIGGGGGLISLPIYLLAGLPTHLALGTNKLSSCIGTAASTYRYLHHGHIDPAEADAPGLTRSSYERAYRAVGGNCGHGQNETAQASGSDKILFYESLRFFF